MSEPSKPVKVHFALDKGKLTQEEQDTLADLLGKEAKHRKLAGSHGKMSLEKATSVMERNKPSNPVKALFVSDWKSINEKGPRLRLTQNLKRMKV